MSTVQAILSRMDDVLVDPTSVHWTQAERLRWIGDGRRELARLRPDLYSVEAIINLVAGVAQTVTGRFMDARCTVSPGGADVTTVREADVAFFDAYLPGWRAATAGETKNFMRTPQPEVFNVYPPAVAGAKLRVLHSPPPADFAAATDALLPQEEIYIGPLALWAAGCCVLDDAENAADVARGQALQAMFKEAVVGGAKGQAAAVAQPKDPSR